ncbi:MAG: GNAT family N-acetyltransferase [bacterium]|nr:GNAT family N-acetyltransferase [bacterium]
MKITPIEIRPVGNGQELEAALGIREAVFAEELGIFSGSDRDRHDEKAVHLIALDRGKVVGTVRVYREEGIWMGGRLAVDRKHRSGVGRKLVQAAEAEVKRQGGSSMQAMIQAQNVHFFERLGWKKIGPETEYLGHQHYRMEKVFDRDQKLETRNSKPETSI